MKILKTIALHIPDEAAAREDALEFLRDLASQRGWRWSGHLHNNSAQEWRHKSKSLPEILIPTSTTIADFGPVFCRVLQIIESDAEEFKVTVEFI